jgi:hypothetical protein
MLKRMAQIVLIAGGLVVLLMALTMGWLKFHEDDIVFATARGRQHLLATLPADAQRVTVPEPNGAGLAAVIYRADTGTDQGFWVLHLHGNADSAFSPGQVRHCEALRAAGFNVLEIDYRGFGPTPGKPSEAAMYEDSEAAYQDLLRREIPPNRIILLGHSLGSGPAVLLATRHQAAALVLFGAFTSIPEAAAYRYPYLPVRMVVGPQFNNLARIGAVHIPVLITHSRNDKLIPYANALTLFAAANQPKRLITFDAASNDGFGGHVDTLYEHVDMLEAALATLVPALQSSANP